VAEHLGHVGQPHRGQLKGPLEAAAACPGEDARGEPLKVPVPGVCLQKRCLQKRWQDIMV
jgi:hypothetical protein